MNGYVASTNSLPGTEWLLQVADQPPLWTDVFAQIEKIQLLGENWDDQGAKKLDTSIIEAGRSYLLQLQVMRLRAPDDLYPLSDGTLILEWQLPNAIIIRDELLNSGQGERMISYPDAKRPVEFYPFHWSHMDSPCEVTLR